jgi:hypothetical protein
MLQPHDGDRGPELLELMVLQSLRLSSDHGLDHHQETLLPLRLPPAGTLTQCPGNGPKCTQGCHHFLL